MYVLKRTLVLRPNVRYVTAETAENPSYVDETIEVTAEVVIITLTAILSLQVITTPTAMLVIKGRTNLFNKKSISFLVVFLLNCEVM